MIWRKNAPENAPALGVEPGPVQVDPAELAAELERERLVAAARRRHELEGERAEAGHGRDRADLAEALRLAELERAERAEDIAATVGLARLYRQARAAGERTRITSEMARSGEARALRLERLRRRNLLVLVPLLVGFGVWSTTGVQQGAARLMSVDTHSPVWWVLWGLEALLIGLVCWVIICRATIGSAGGSLDTAAEKTAAGALTVSIFLNLIAAVPGGEGASSSAGWWAIPGSMFAHLIGPVGAAVTAHLIGVVDRSITEADPWTGEDGRPAPRLAEMDLAAPALVTAAPVLGALEAGHVDASDNTRENTPSAEAGNSVENTPGNVAENAVERPVTRWPVPTGGRRVLPVVARPAAGNTVAGTGSAEDARTGGERGKGQVSETVRKTRPGTRPNKGTTVPQAAKPPAKNAREFSDEELLGLLAGALSSGQARRSVRSVMGVLGIGYDRARRLLDTLENAPENTSELTSENGANNARQDTDDVGDGGVVYLTSAAGGTALAMAGSAVNGVHLDKGAQR
ncbi:hypothetical protein ACIBF1_44230 [Spirillospora sp. NPDC050679]